MHRAFKAHYRRILPELLGTLEFRCANPKTQPVMQALQVVKAHLGAKGPCYPKDVNAPMEGVVRPSWRPLVVEAEGDPPTLNQATYEVCTIRALREQLRWLEASFPLVEAASRRDGGRPSWGGFLGFPPGHRPIERGG